MDLILWRHAEAEERRPGLPDDRRSLTPKGEKQARKMAKWLKKRLPSDARILVSPTERTRMTADALGMPYEIEDRIGPEASVADMIAAAEWPKRDGAVLIVGHQPTLGRIAARLLAGDDREWAVKKGAIWWLSSHDRSGGTLPLLVAAIGSDAV